MNIETVISDMFVENTGRGICDSGDAYGRHWERNQKQHPKDQPEIEFEIWNGTIQYTINTYHYLIKKYDLDEICDGFNKTNIGCDNWHCEEMYGVSSEAWDHLKECGHIKFLGDTWNTSNYDSSLSQVLQGQDIMIDGHYYTILQLHNGCDIREGYTDARLFKDSDRYIDVYGTCIRDGVEYSISNLYDGCNVTWDDVDIPDDTDFHDSDEIELWLN